MLFKRAFEVSNAKFAKVLLAPLLKYILPAPEDLEDDLAPVKNKDHLRLNAVKIFLSIVD